MRQADKAIMASDSPYPFVDKVQILSEGLKRTSLNFSKKLNADQYLESVSSLKERGNALQEVADQELKNIAKVRPSNLLRGKNL